MRPQLYGGIDAIDYYAVELNKVDNEIKRWRGEGHHETSAGACIVTFCSTADAAHYLQTHREAHRTHLINTLRSRFSLPHAGSPPKYVRGIDETTSRPRLAVPLHAAEYAELPPHLVDEGGDATGQGEVFDGAKQNILSWAVERAPSVRNAVCSFCVCRIRVRSLGFVHKL